MRIWGRGGEDHKSFAFIYLPEFRFFNQKTNTISYGNVMRPSTTNKEPDIFLNIIIMLFELNEE